MPDKSMMLFLRRPVVDESRNEKLYERFCSDLPDDKAWVKQALNSYLFVGNPNYIHGLENNELTKISLERDAVVITYRDPFFREERSQELPLEELRNYTYEANGLSQPDVSAEFPKFDLIRQANERERAAQVRTIDSGPDCQRILYLLVCGVDIYRVGLESVTFDEVPLNETERDMIDLFNLTERVGSYVYYQELTLFRGSNRRLHDSIGLDAVRRYGMVALIFNPLDVFPYLTPTGRKLVELQNAIKNGEIKDVDGRKRNISHILGKYGRGLNDAVYTAKAKASFIESFDLSRGVELLDRTHAYSRHLDELIKKHGMQRLGKETNPFEKQHIEGVSPLT